MNDRTFSETGTEVRFCGSISPKIGGSCWQNANKGGKQASEEPAQTLSASDIASDREGALGCESDLGAALGGLEMCFDYLHWTGDRGRYGACDAAGDERGEVFLIAE